MNYNRLIADCGQELFLHPLREIKRILIMTTAQRVFNQTVFLVFETPMWVRKILYYTRRGNYLCMM